MSLALRGYSALVASELRTDALDGVFAAWLDGYTVKSLKCDGIELSSPFANEEITFVIE